MSSRRQQKNNNNINNHPEQIDMDSLFDFNQGTTPVAASSSKMDNSVWSPFDQSEERQQFNGPSHDYNQYKQQVGLPLGSVSNMPQQSMSDGYNSGIADMSFDSSWATGIDMDTDVSMDFNNLDSNMPAMFFPGPNNAPDAFVNPNNLGAEEPVSNVGRLWPGMHSQQAAMQKAAQSQQVVQSRQMKTQFQQQQQQQQQHQRQASVSGSQNAPNPSQSNSKRPAALTDPRVEERISRLLEQMRHNSNASNEDESSSPSDLLPNIARMKKDEDDMDEDERLLASEEGKKLSSKERRQLRNKVSARAFRSRRKEYITQLEGEVAVKAQENAALRSENDSLVQENERYRGFIETILRHPAFGPFMNDLSKDPSMLGLPQHQASSQQQQPQQQQQSQSQSQSQSQQQQQSQTSQQSQQQSQAPQQQQQLHDDGASSFINFDASQLHVPNQQTERVGLATIPENDFSKLNINGFQAQNFNDFRSVNAFAVTDLPTPELSTLLVDATADSYFSSVNSHSDILAPVAQSGAGLDLLLAKLDRAASRTCS